MSVVAPLTEYNSDPSPYAQGYQDWLVFGDAANALDCEEYARGKRDAKRRFYSGRPWEKTL